MAKIALRGPKVVIHPLMNFLCLALCFQTANAADMLQLRQAEKLSLTLTGKPLSKEMRADFLKGGIDLKTIGERLTKSPDFIEYYAAYWTRALGVQLPVNPYALRTVDNNQPLSNAGRYLDWSFLAFPPNVPGVSLEFLQAFYDARVSGATPPQLEVKLCDDMPTLSVVAAFSGRDAYQALGTKGQANSGEKAMPGTEALWTKTWELFQQYDLECGEGGTIVKPWWDPEKVTIHSKYKDAPGYRVPPMTLKACGPNLKNCDIRSSAGSNAYMDEVSRAMTMEAGYLIAHTVAEDLPFSDVLTTPRTVMTGAYGYFMSRDIGFSLWKNFPANSYNDYKHAIFTSAGPLDKSQHWIMRNEQHAGVLTTPVFQLLTNGRRAKANRAYETFLCRKFVLPESAKPDPTDNNPDLTKRAYCAFCHIFLEPMADFFNKWPLTGVNNYEFYANEKDQGSFAGKSGSGALGLGRILSEHPQFEECSIVRAFEFVNRRKMNEAEMTMKMPQYKAAFGDRKNMRQLIMHMMQEAEFLAPKGE